MNTNKQGDSMQSEWGANDGAIQEDPNGWDDESDGQPTEQEEWASFDPDC